LVGKIDPGIVVSTPPSIENSPPLTKEEASERRNAMTSPTSLGDPNRPSGVRDIMSSFSPFWLMLANKSVSMKPGSTALALIRGRRTPKQLLW